jgi:RimJ/RimL family protein N-acetyltransferase
MQTLLTDRLVLEPLVVAHAHAMFDVLRDPAIYRYLDYPPPASLEHLQRVYARLAGRKSADGSELWLNWVVSPLAQPPVGYVQATVYPEQSASVAYVLSSRHWGRGYASEAVQAMLEHLASAYGSRRYRATVEAENTRSIQLLHAVGRRAQPFAHRAPLRAGRGFVR